MTSPRIADYPGCMIRVACRHCSRRGQYRAEALLARYGPLVTFADLLARLGNTCTAGADRKPGPCRGPFIAAPAVPELETPARTSWRGQERYTCFRSIQDHRTHIICGDGTFDQLPATIRHCGPWQGGMGGEMRRLRPLYRALIDEQGFAVVYAQVTVFRPDVGTPERGPADRAVSADVQPLFDDRDTQGHPRPVRRPAQPDHGH